MEMGAAGVRGFRGFRGYLRTSLPATQVVCRAVQKGLSLQELSNVGNAGGWQKVTRREKLFVRFQERLKWRG